MSLQLTYLATADAVPVEIEGLTPDWAADKSLAEIERFPVLHGNREVPLAELFRATGKAADLRLDFEGDLAGVHRIGAHMCAGEINVQGPVGRHVGSGMRGGAIRVRGDAGDWAGAEMHGGLLRIDGRAGDLVGAAYRGAARGMTGGDIVIGGDAGSEVGRAMRHGMIAIGGSTDELTGYQMIAGSIVICGNAGPRIGAGMRRGTICSLGSAPPRLLPTFRFACRSRPPVIALMLRRVRDLGLPVDASRPSANLDLFNGDLLALGRGEIYLPAELAV
jgi:formylmethanofuran dehydrogenase subunit C